MLHGDGVPAGAFGDWKRGTTQTWCGQPPKALTAAERQAARKRIKDAHTAANAERARQHADAAASARRIWVRSHDADESNSYCKRNELLVPLYNATGELANVQFIYPTGGKRFREEITRGAAHWVERQIDPGPYRLRATRQPGADDKDESDDDYGYRDSDALHV